jgi:hypothetical protein
MEGWCGRDQAGGRGLDAFDSGCTAQWRPLSGPTAPATGGGGGTFWGRLTYKVKNSDPLSPCMGQGGEDV